jgi:hypothetical protein
VDPAVLSTLAGSPFGECRKQGNASRKDLGDTAGRGDLATAGESLPALRLRPLDADEAFGKQSAQQASVMRLLEMVSLDAAES